MQVQELGHKLRFISPMDNSLQRAYRYNCDCVIAYAEYGDGLGYPILLQHGAVASISDYHLFDRLIEAGTRLICVARPGYGASSPYPMRNVAEWGEIMAALTDELGIAECDVLGMSAGAPYSYAIAHGLQERVRDVFIFSGTPALYDDQVLGLWPYPANRDASLSDLEDVARSVFFANLSETDLQRADIRDSMSNRCFGIAQDLKLRCRDWGFELSALRHRVYMQHSRQDQDVPFGAAKLTAEMLPDCRFEVRRSGGHFSEELLDHFIRKTMLSHYGNRTA
jgi:pimeloyl-ACP methyl ester carboxylesterase